MNKVVINECYGGFNFSNAALAWLKENGLTAPWYDLPRHHPLLVRCVQELGEDASGPNSELVVVSVNRYYIINEYDGYESVQEPNDIEWFDSTIIDSKTLTKLY